jgi:hypothetical protein
VELTEMGASRESSPSTSAAVTSDRAVELVGLGSFHVWLILILTLGNASDAVEVLSIGLVLPNLAHLSDADEGVLTAAAIAGALLGRPRGQTTRARSVVRAARRFRVSPIDGWRGWRFRVLGEPLRGGGGDARKRRLGVRVRSTG